MKRQDGERDDGADTPKGQLRGSVAFFYKRGSHYSIDITLSMWPSCVLLHTTSAWVAVVATSAPPMPKQPMPTSSGRRDKRVIPKTCHCFIPQLPNSVQLKKLSRHLHRGVSRAHLLQPGTSPRPAYALKSKGHAMALPHDAWEHNAVRGCVLSSMAEACHKQVHIKSFSYTVRPMNNAGLTICERPVIVSFVGSLLRNRGSGNYCCMLTPQADVPTKGAPRT